MKKHLPKILAMLFVPGVFALGWYFGRGANPDNSVKEKAAVSKTESTATASSTPASTPIAKSVSPASVAQPSETPATSATVSHPASPSASESQESRQSTVTVSRKGTARNAGKPAGHQQPPAQSSASSTVISDSSLAQPKEIVLELELGVQMPAAFIELEGEELSQQTAAAKEKIAGDFEGEVGAVINTETSPEDTSDAWESAKSTANERYRLLFGDKAYNDATMKATLEAMQGKATSGQE